METIMGVFASRERAEETVKELLDKHVPQEAIVFLTRSESEAMYLGKTLGSFVGGFVGGGVGVTAGVVAATLFPFRESGKCSPWELVQLLHSGLPASPWAKSWQRRPIYH